MYLTHAQLEALWVTAGGKTSEADTGAAIALAESGGNTHATNHNTNGTWDRGPWQINDVHGYNHQLLVSSPIYSARAAVTIRNQRGSFVDWVTYNNGAYRKFLTGSVGVSGDASLGTHSSGGLGSAVLGGLIGIPLGPAGLAAGALLGGTGAAGAAVSAIGNLDSVGKFLSHLGIIFSGAFWLRVFMAVGGVALIGTGLFLTGKEMTIGGAVRAVSKAPAAWWKMGDPRKG